MDRTSNPILPRFDARSRRQRRQDTIRRYASALSQPSPPALSSTGSATPVPPPSRTPGIRFGVEAGQSTLLRHRLRSARDSQRSGTVQETLNELDHDLGSSRANTSGLSQTLPVPNFDNEHSGLLDGPEYGRRNKRRKLDADPLDKHPKISYGYHGQVAPGKLNMMISYCDGGTLHDDNKQYGPENILKNDKSVYCSRKSKVNLMLAHWHEVTFTCTKIVIKTPDSGFPAPLQEGMVFVSMDAQNIRESTSQFQLESCFHAHARSPPPPESSRYRTRPRLSNGAWQLNPSEPQPSAASQGANDSSEHFDFDRFLEGTGEMNYDHASYHDDTSLMPPLARMAGRRSSTLITRSAYSENISISCENVTDDEEDTTAEPVLEDRRRRGQQAETDSEDEEDELHYSSSNRSSRQRFNSRPIEWVENRASSSRIPTDDRVKPPGPDVPYTKFFIERKKHVVSVKFDPPVSGRYILLKLWSPQGRDSLDLQSVCVYGFAGPRFFPIINAR